jgi:hypothetical protein
MTSWIRGTGLALLSAVVAVFTPGYVAAQLPAAPPSGAALYELTENLSLKALKGGQRKATSQLLGVARSGTPLCPTTLGADCTINATGSDNISLATGLGTFGGTFTVVVQGDNPVDGPEAVVARGHFSGKMDFSPAILNGVPLGTVTGEVGLNGNPTVPFTGTFRLPFGSVSSAFYLDSAGQMQPVLPEERALGYPTVKFEISFPASN